jgi:hypothetical protein
VLPLLWYPFTPTVQIIMYLFRTWEMCQVSHYYECQTFLVENVWVTRVTRSGATSGAGTAYPSRAPEFTAGF